MLEIRNMSCRAGSFALKHVNLRLPEGSYCVVLGSSGAGKTVFLETLAGRYPVTEGNLDWNGRDLASLPLEKRRIGFVYQDYALFPHLNVAENIAFPLRFSSCPRHERESKVQALLDMLDLGKVATSRPDVLSGGEQQRTAVGRALAMDPDLLLFDEPLSALDCVTKEQLQYRLKELHRTMGKTVIHVTHDFEVARYLADHMVFMRHHSLSPVMDRQTVLAMKKEDVYAQLER